MKKIKNYIFFRLELSVIRKKNITQINDDNNKLLIKQYESVPLADNLLRLSYAFLSTIL